jgi:hypothetical protein
MPPLMENLYLSQQKILAEIYFEEFTVKVSGD